MTLEIIQAKRAALLAECERAKGAIQALDDLISEVAADRESAKAAEAQYSVTLDVNGYVSGFDLVSDSAPAPFVPLASESPPMSPPSPPEMFGREPLLTPCDNCLDHDDCRDKDCVTHQK